MYTYEVMWGSGDMLVCGQPNVPLGKAFPVPIEGKICNESKKS